ncbi:MAG: helix-turn-helix transcriptional regulator [bacterium]
MLTLGQYIREERDKNGTSLREFAKKIGCSPAFISDIELGKRNPSEEVFAKIAKYLNISLDELKKHDTRPPTEDLRKLNLNPKLAFAFRTLMDRDVKPEALIKFAENYSKKKNKDNTK